MPPVGKDLLRGLSSLSPYQQFHGSFLTPSQHHQGHHSRAPGQPGRVAAAQLSPDAPCFRSRAVGKFPVPAPGATLASSCMDLCTPSQILSQTMAEGPQCGSHLSGTLSTRLEAVYFCVPSGMCLPFIPNRLWSCHDRKASQPPCPSLASLRH